MYYQCNRLISSLAISKELKSKYVRQREDPGRRNPNKTKVFVAKSQLVSKPVGVWGLTRSPVPTEPAFRITPFGETKMPEPIIVPTIRLTPPIRLTSLFR